MSDDSNLPNSAPRPLTRRDLLHGTACVAVATVAATASGQEVSDSKTTDSKNLARPEARLHSLDEIDPKNLVDAYAGRRLGDLSDREIIRAAADIISQPGEGMSSFTLHAPLELLARSGLLPLVAPEDRELARLQIVTSASVYQRGTKALPRPAAVAPFGDFDTARSELARVFSAGDEAGLEAVILSMAQEFSTAGLVHTLTPLLLPTLTAASHSHIGLWLLLRHGAAGDPADAGLLRAAARMLAADPKGRLQSFAGLTAIHDGAAKPLKKTPAQVESFVLERLASPEKAEERKTRGIRGLMEAAEGEGTADREFGEFIRHDLTDEQITAAFRAALRASAHAMLQDDVGSAKFGWSHCLTLPQAAFGLSSLGKERKLGLAATLVWATAYRTVLSKKKTLDFAYRPKKVTASLREALHGTPDEAAGRFWHLQPDEQATARRLLASEAAVRNDQHLAKYTRACFDMCSLDPTQWRLYFASAAKLCALWIAETPREKISDRLSDGRRTPF